MKIKIALPLILGAMSLFAHVDTYDSVLFRYEKLSDLNKKSLNGNHFQLKHDLFFDNSLSDLTRLKGYGTGWCGNYEYLAPMQPYFSIEGAHLETDNMDWKGHVPMTHTFQRPTEKGTELIRQNAEILWKVLTGCEVPQKKEELLLADLPEIVEALKDFIENDKPKIVGAARDFIENNKPTIFVLHGKNYYSEELIPDERYQIIDSSEVLHLSKDFISGKHHWYEYSAYEHFEKNLSKLFDKNYQYILYNGKKYFRAKDRFDAPEWRSLGTAKKTLADISMKLGKNLTLDKKTSVTPFVGFGYHSVQHTERLAELDSLVEEGFERHPELHLTSQNDTYYSSIGGKVRYDFNSYFGVGLNAQLNHGLAYNTKGFALQQSKNLFDLVGYRAALPISVRFGKKPNFNLEVEPYIDQFDVGHKETNTGVKLSTGISF